MNKRNVAVISLTLGVALVVGSLIWASIIPDQAIWSAQQASRVTQNAVRVHNEMTPGADHNHNDRQAEVEAEFDIDNPHARAEKLMQEHAKMRAQLDQARFVRYRLPFFLRIVGVIMILVAGIFVLNDGTTS